MKSIIRQTYGGPETLEIIQQDRPHPQTGEVLIKVVASALTQADTMLRSGKPYFARFFLGWPQPKNQQVGTGFSGEIIGLGEQVHNFKFGDQVFGEMGMKFGAHSEYITLHQDDLLWNKPDNISHQEACCICDGPLTSLNFITRVATTQQKNHILINGASGSLGSAAIQIAKILNMSVTAVCSQKNHSYVSQLGADHLIDYKETHFYDQSNEYDIVFDCIGYSSFSESKGCLKSSGQYITPVLNFAAFKGMLLHSARAKFAATGMEEHSILKKLMEELLGYIQGGHLHIPIDKVFQYDDIQEAHTYVDSMRKRGNCVLNHL